MSQLISVIMPAYNAESYIQEAIDSILNQSYANFELLVADDKSTDETRSIIDAYTDKRIKAFHNTKNIGYLKTCNKLLAFCQGDFITFQDADDWSEANRLELILSEFSTKKNISLLGSYSRYFVDGTNDTFKIRKCEADYNSLVKEIQTNNPFDGATICIKKEVYESIGGYKEYYDRMGSEDFDWLCRISDLFEIGVLPQVLYQVRISPKSVSRSLHSPMQLISNSIVLYCNEQRRQNGIDSLSDKGDISVLNQFVERKMEPFQNDPSLIFRKEAEMAMYNMLFQKALKSSFKAIQKKPSKIINYRTLLYVIRKANFNIFV